MGNLLTTLISFFPFLSYFQEKVEDHPTETSKPSNKDEGEIVSEENPVNSILPNSEQNTREEILDMDEDISNENTRSLENTLDLMTRGSESRMMDEFLSENNNQNCIDTDEEIHSNYSEEELDLNETFELIKSENTIKIPREFLVKSPEKIILETRNSVEITSINYNDDRETKEILTRERVSMQVNVSTESDDSTSERNNLIDEVLESSSDSINVILNLKANDSGLTDTSSSLMEKANLITENVIESASLEIKSCLKPRVSFAETDSSESTSIDSAGDNTQEEVENYDKVARNIVEQAIDCGAAEVTGQKN